MRRKDREVTDFNEMLELIDEEEVLRLALSDEAGTYIVPVNYGYQYGSGEEGNVLSFFIHGAAQGRKANILTAAASSGSEIPFEIDGRHLPEISDSCDASYYYMSVIGTVRVTVLDSDEKLNALNALMDNVMPADEYHFQESVVERTMLCRLDVTSWTCKKH